MSWLAVALWGGVVGLDAASFPQVMLSRPLVAGAVTGSLLGRPLEGTVLGALLEVFSLVFLPVGAARYPESGTAAVASTAAYAAVAGGAAEVVPHLLLAATVFGLLWEQVTGRSVHLARRLNEWLVARATERGGLGDGRLERLHLTAMALDFLRAAAVVLLGLLAGSAALSALASRWGVAGDLSIGVLTIAAATMLGALLPLFGGWCARRTVFMLGVLCGAGLLFFR
jgi:mannose/fructose/N-acetylgalactosamine-specific phosphotransferase system component IIC